MGVYHDPAMAYVFSLPDIGDGLTEADVVRWHVQVGDAVESDQILVEVETDKAVVAIPAPTDGTVLVHGAAEGETLAVGSTLAVIGAESEPWPENGGSTPHPDEPRVASVSGGTRPPGPVHRGRAKALPAVRRLAREHGVDLAMIHGTGPGGMITRDDVMAATSLAPRRPQSKSGRQVVSLSMLRRTIAENMSKSWREIPHATLFHDADATRLLEARRAVSARYGRTIPVEALVVMALVPLLEEFPFFNATLDRDELILHREVNVGVAVDTEDGLIVPVVRGAEKLGLMDLSATVLDLADRGKTRRLAPSDLTGATFTLSNIGALGGSRGTPIIPSGTTSLLAFGRASDTPVVRDGIVVPAPMMPLSLAFDHRVIDGGSAQLFVNKLAQNLSEPTLFLVS